MSENKCRTCAHNLAPAGLECEFACAGVTRIEDEGWIVAACDDYLPKEAGQCTT